MTASRRSANYPLGPGPCAFGVAASLVRYGLSLTRQCAPLPIMTWERSFTTHSWKLDCLRLPCAWNCQWERSPTLRNGITIPCAVCDRRSSSCVCPSSRWVVLILWCRVCKPRLQNRRLLDAGLHLSGRGAAKLRLIVSRRN